MTYLTNSILPAAVLHTDGNMYSNADLWLHGRAEWQAAGAETLGAPGASSWTSLGTILVLAGAMLWAYFMLASSARKAQRRVQSSGAMAA